MMHCKITTFRSATEILNRKPEINGKRKERKIGKEKRKGRGKSNECIVTLPRLYCVLAQNMADALFLLVQLVGSMTKEGQECLVNDHGCQYSQGCARGWTRGL